MRAYIEIDEKGNESIKSIYLSAIDSRYPSLMDIEVFFSGSPFEVKDFLEQVVTFSKTNEVGVGTLIGTQNVSIRRIMGSRFVSIDCQNSSAYCSVYGSKLEESLEYLNAYISKNKALISDPITNSILPDSNKAPVPNTAIKTTPSLADELTKLKKLMDEGVLTKEEFEAQKKKLLEK